MKTTQPVVRPRRSPGEILSPAHAAPDGAAIYWSPDVFGLDEEATCAEVNTAFAPADKWTVSAAVWLDVNADRASWNVGVACAVSAHVAIEVRYHDADVHGPLWDSRAVAGLKFLF
ncbi:MAG: hypothetical protein Q8M32_04110 [Brevundimonas sp.]|uniref:hypothetical protein n=1 Tax=Brevundimonas sp. TaxID=1871086 RepID=UPI0027193E52|nr:hypothetical protein [Brevundimonas sp.]MDO9587305.1 hypothetical protein [Brevundimonas sp.]MDP3369014.1 hypothetical protein [Brevundimonas sp.]